MRAIGQLIWVALVAALVVAVGSGRAKDPPGHIPQPLHSIRMEAVNGWR